MGHSQRVIKGVEILSYGPGSSATHAKPEYQAAFCAQSPLNLKPIINRGSFMPTFAPYTEE